MNRKNAAGVYMRKKSRHGLSQNMHGDMALRSCWIVWNATNRPGSYIIVKGSWVTTMTLMIWKN